jgi:hypothetical protein
LHHNAPVLTLFLDHVVFIASLQNLKDRCLSV